MFGFLKNVAHAVSRWKWLHSVTVLAVMLTISAIRGQDAPSQDFLRWARDHVHRIVTVEQAAHDDADLQELAQIIGNAHLVALGELVHGRHEPLAIRNRLFAYAVKHLGFTAVALETCLGPSKQLYDYVLGRTPQADRSLNEGFCYGFGNFPENIELIE